jgi:hypothetical protein
MRLRHAKCPLPECELCSPDPTRRRVAHAVLWTLRAVYVLPFIVAILVVISAIVSLGK